MYFQWKTMPYAPARDGARVPVVIVGAGPIGLAMAQALARRGVRSLVIEQRDRLSDGSRAVAYTRRTMQILDAVGVGTAVLKQAINWDQNTVHYGDRLVYEMQLPQPDGEKHRMTNLQQCWVEQILVDALAQGGLAEVHWGCQVESLEQDGDGVRLSVYRKDGVRFGVSADYVVGADGSRGSTRKHVGLDYEGRRFEQRFVITDYHMRSDAPAGRQVWFSPPYAPGTTVLQHKEPFDVWRLDYQLRPGEDSDEELKPERIEARLKAHLEMIGETAPYEIIWTSVYRANAISLPAYRASRVLFVGDAAHQIPIFGGRGINNGFLDVVNLAWKLELVLSGRAPERLLDSYDTERRPAILSTIEDLTKVTLYMTSPSAGVQLMRDAVLSLSLSERFVHALFDPFRLPAYPVLSIDADAATAAADQEFPGGAVLGQVLPDTPVRRTDEEAKDSRLLDILGPGFSLLCFGGNDAADATCQSIFQAVTATDLQIRCIAVGATRAITGAAAIADTGIASRLGAIPGAAYLVRPDQHVAGRWLRASAPAIIARAAATAGQTSNKSKE
ncbi:MAG: FAD-dependent monooxygenase [Ramlibacter sp.]